MKFRVERDALGEAVAWVARALPARPVIPVLSGLLVQASGAGLTLSCFDYEVSARVVVPAEVAEPGSALVPGRLLAEITRSLPPRIVDFATVADMVSLTCGGAEFELVSLPVEEYPGLPEPPAPSGIVDGGALAAAAAQVVPAASRDDTLPMLTGVCVDVEGPAMTLAATDRYRLAVRTVDWTPAIPGLRAAALVPARTLADVARTMGAGVPVTVAFSAPEISGGWPGAPVSGEPVSGEPVSGEPVSGEPVSGEPVSGEAVSGHSARSAQAEPRPADGMISFEGGGRRLTARPSGGDFIRYRSRFPAEFGCHAEIAAEPFMAAVRRVSLVAERASPVRLTFGPDEVTIEAHTDGRARAVESVPAAFAGDEPVISFNPNYLLDGLTAAAVCGAVRPQPGTGDAAGAAEPEPGRIRLEFTSPAKPALITWVGYEGGLAATNDATAAAPAEESARKSANGAVMDAEIAVATVADEGIADDAVADDAVANDAVANAVAAGAVADPGGNVTPGAGDDGTPAFRYLVVPLRSPAASGAGRA